MSFLEKQRREGMDERADRTKKIYKVTAVRENCE
jgi:hypothetical protein